MKLHLAEFTPKPLTVDLIRLERKTLAISVFPDQGVEVVAPLKASEEDIVSKILKRRRWILRQQKYFRQLASRNTSNQPQLLISGAEVLYLGRQYRLKIELDDDSRKAKLRGRYLQIPVQRNHSPDGTRETLVNWYRARAEDYLPKRMKKVHAQISHLDLPEYQLRIRAMKTRWGSCTAKGVITLNPLLVLAPSHLIDYVLIHELCHLKHPNHGKNFYQLLDSTLPDYKDRKRNLDQFGAITKGTLALFSC